MTPPAPARAGFTLIEVLTAVTVTALLFTGASALLGGTMARTREAQARAAFEESSRTALAVLENDLRSLRVAPALGAKSGATPLFFAPDPADPPKNARGDMLVLRLTTAAGGYFQSEDAPGRLYDVLYLLRPVPGDPDRRLLARLERPHPDLSRRNARDAPVRELILADAVTSLTVACDEGKETELTSWDSRMRRLAGKDELPKGVRLRLTRRSGERSRDWTLETLLAPDVLRGP